MIFNSAGPLPNVIGTFTQIYVSSESVSVYFPSLTNQGPSLLQGNYCSNPQQAGLAGDV